MKTLEHFQIPFKSSNPMSRDRRSDHQDCAEVILSPPSLMFVSRAFSKPVPMSRDSQRCALNEFLLTLRIFLTTIVYSKHLLQCPVSSTPAFALQRCSTICASPATGHPSSARELERLTAHRPPACRRARTLDLPPMRRHTPARPPGHQHLLARARPPAIRSRARAP